VPDEDTLEKIWPQTTAKSKIEIFTFTEVNNGSLASTARETWLMLEVCFDEDLSYSDYNIQNAVFREPTEK